MRKKLSLSLILFCISLFSVPAFSYGAEDPILRIGGLVQSPIYFSFSDLQQFRQEEISALEGVEAKARMSAVSLSTLIGLAKSQEPVEELAISLKNIRGDQIILSGGEVFLKSRSRFFIAGSVVGDNKLREHLPALIMEDNYKSRIVLRQISFIEVISIANPHPANPRRISLPGTLSGTLVKINNAQGYPLKAILETITPKIEPTDILRIKARGRGAFAVSPQELASEAAPIIVPRREGGKYDLALPGYSKKGQLLEEIESIEAISLKQKAMMYVVGVGCGDPNLLTNEAISIMAKADVFVSKDDYQKTFAGYIAGRPVLFDPFMQLGRYQKSRHPEFSDAEAEKRANEVYADNIRMLKKALSDGEIIALLEPGDPALYGGWRNWLSGYIPQDQIKIIAGMSSFSVANAVLGEHDISKNAIIIAEPEQLIANELLMQSAAEKGNVLVLFMALSRMKSLVPLLGKYFSPETPVNVVYFAGIAGKERRVQTRLSKVMERTAAERENFLGLVYIGRDLKASESQK